MFATFILAAVSAQSIQLALSPIYGSIPSTRARAGAIPLPWSSTVHLALPELWVMPLVILIRTYSSKRTQASIQRALPAFGMCLPVILSESFRFSVTLGPMWGPVLTIFCTTSPLIVLSSLAFINDIEGIRGGGSSKQGFCRSDIALVIGCYMVMSKMHDVVGGHMGTMSANLATVNPVFGRFGLLTILSLCYALLERSRKTLVVVGGLVLLHLVLFNLHLPSTHNNSRLNATLQSGGYSLVARQESLTGYISVLDNINDHFRVMRCDHSLLGGEWTNKPAGHPAILNEPIYSIFVMLEAVRLVETERFRERGSLGNDIDSALIIGLGVGTAPAALIAHGVDVTTVEIDPVVHDFAEKYFDLQRNHTSIIGDAVRVVEDLQQVEQSYDFIIHDVFTGGAEPVELFTQEFLMDLKRLLAPSGVIAINYAGDLLLPSAISVIQTVESVFPKCRLFRETAPAIPLGSEDYTNIVMFCRTSTGDFWFRDPMEADFLGSPARRQHLLPRNEVASVPQGKGEIIRRGHTAGLEASQVKSAIGHWYVMRAVLPAEVWENW